ncbi:MAG: SMP-30/gluconolactonase/LRE family protein [Fimbriiglobus sp.]
MLTRRLLLLACLVGFTGFSFADDKKPETMGSVVRIDAKFDELIPKDAVIEVLAGGFKWSEGPVWVKDGSYLLFSDIPNNRVCKWSEKEGLEANYLKPSGFTVGAKFDGNEPGANGLALDKTGALILCQHGDRRIARLGKDGKFTTLADKHDGKRFNSPNDLAYHPNGDLYFTDPPYGLPKGMDDAGKEIPYQGVYRLKPTGEVTLLTKEMTRPNGIAFSPDAKTLYVANSDPALAIWKSFPVKEDGTLGEGKVFFDATPMVKAKKPGLPDGLKVDTKGNVFATGPGGVLVFDATGKHLGTIATNVPTANCGFGGDGSTLFITANDKLVRIKTTTKGW